MGRAEALLWEELADTALNGFVVAARWADDDNWARGRDAYFGDAPWFVGKLIAPQLRRRVVANLVARDVWRTGAADAGGAARGAADAVVVAAARRRGDAGAADRVRACGVTFAPRSFGRYTACVGNMPTGEPTLLPGGSPHMPNVPTKSQVMRSVMGTLRTEAAGFAGKGKVLTAVEQKLIPGWTNLLSDTARTVRQEGGRLTVDRWIDASASKITDALNAVDNKGPGKGFISLTEARTATASQRDAGERIGRAFELLTGKTLIPSDPPAPAVVAATKQLFADGKIGVVASLIDIKTVPAWIEHRVEQAMEEAGAEGWSTITKANLAGRAVYVGTGSAWEDDGVVESLIALDKDGRIAGKATIAENNDTGVLTMKDSDGETIATLPAADAAPAPAAWKAALEKSLAAKYDADEDLGVEVEDESSKWPEAIKARYGFTQRNTGDGVGMQRVDFDGRSAWAIFKYESVTSAAVYSDAGERLCEFGG